MRPRTRPCTVNGKPGAYSFHRWVNKKVGEHHPIYAGNIMPHALIEDIDGNMSLESYVNIKFIKNY